MMMFRAWQRKAAHTMVIGIGLITAMLSSPTSRAEESPSELIIRPSFHYRLIGLTTNNESVFHKDEHQDNNQQVVLTAMVKGKSGYQHEYVLEPSIRTKRSRFDENQLETRFEQGYVNTKLANRLYVQAGKKEEYEGPGVLVNPSDLLNEDRKLFDSLYYRQGKMLARVQTSIGSNQTLSVTALPKKGQGSKEAAGLFRYNVMAGSTNATVKYKYSRDVKSTWALSGSQFLGEFLEVHAEGRYQSKQRSADDFRERAFSDWRQDDPSLAGLGGVRLIFAPQRSFVGEYIANQSGLTKDEYVNFLTSLKTGGELDREPDDRLLSRQYALAAYYDEKLIPNSTFEIAFVRCLLDGSSFSSAKIQWHVSEVTAIELNGILYRGAELTEFGEMPFRNIGYLSFIGSI